MSKPAPKSGPPTPPQTGRLGRVLPLLVTNAIKLGGLWIVLHEVTTQAQPRLVEMGAALFMMAGAQASEESIVKLAGRIFGGHPESHDPEKKP